MDFSWSETQLELQARMRALGVEANGLDIDKRMQRFGDAGLLGLPLTKEHGGSGFDLLTTASAFEALGSTLEDDGVLLAVGAHLFGVALPFSKIATDEQRALWLPKFANGQSIGTVAATEVASGSDIASVASTVTRTPSGFRLNGEKRFVTYADRADVFFVFASLGASEPRGLVALLVPRSSNGAIVGEAYPTAGLRTARLAPVKFVDCEVPDACVVGRVGAGLAVFQLAMTYERALVLAYRLGRMATLLARCIRFARERKIAGVSLSRHQAVSHRLARMKLQLETSRLLLYQAAWTLDRGQRGQLESALAKWHVSESAVSLALDAMKLHAGAGFLESSGIPGAIDDALGGSIHSGTSDVLAEIVARWLGA